jgi:putative SOS response-associated peptidase YedK
MPVILRPENYEIWLGEKPPDAEALRAARAVASRGHACVPDQHAGEQCEER